MAAKMLGVNRVTVHRWLLRWPEIASSHPPTTRGRPKGSKDRAPRRKWRPWSAEVLGLPWPCTREELTAAWRRAASAAHPDAGGSTAAFVVAKNAYDDLRGLLSGS